MMKYSQPELIINLLMAADTMTASSDSPLSPQAENDNVSKKVAELGNVFDM